MTSFEHSSRPNSEPISNLSSKQQEDLRRVLLKVQADDLAAKMKERANAA